MQAPHSHRLFLPPFNILHAPPSIGLRC